MHQSGIHLLSEHTLVRMAQAGRLEAYDVLALRLRPMLHSLCRSLLGTRELAEDAVQETLIQGFLSIGSLSESAKFRSWMAVIARRRCQLLRSREPKDQTVLTEAIEDAVRARSRAMDPCPSIQMEERQEASALWQALMELPEELRTPLALQVEEDLTLLEIAEILSLPLSTVKWRMHQARQILKQRHSK